MKRLEKWKPMISFFLSAFIVGVLMWTVQQSDIASHFKVILLFVGYLLMIFSAYRLHLTDNEQHEKRKTEKQ